jgi:hypothetical protein
MPEITSVETIRAKLREFEERLDGAITAAKALARIKVDAEKLLANIEAATKKSDQSLEKADAIRFKLQELQLQWHALRQKVEKSEAESQATRDFLLSELESAVQSLGQKVSEAEERLKATNQKSLAEQADLLNQYEANTRASATVAGQAQTTVTETAGKLTELLTVLRNELYEEVRTKLTTAEELLQSETQRVEKYLEKEQAELRQTVEKGAEKRERLLREEMIAFKDDLQRSLAEHQQGIDRQLTDFLNKQNALVQNLNQQIDSYSRASQAQSADLGATNTRLGELSSAFNASKAAVTSELAALTVGVSELKALLSEVGTVSRSQNESIDALDRSLQATTRLVDQTIDKLKHLPLVGGKFK